MGFFWPEYWNGLPFPTLRDLPDPGIEPILLGLLYWQVDSFPLAPPGKPLNSMRRLSDMTWAAILFPQRLPGERQEKRQIQFYLFYLYPTFPWIPLPPIMNLIQSHGLLNLIYIVAILCCTLDSTTNHNLHCLQWRLFTRDNKMNILRWINKCEVQNGSWL